MRPILFFMRPILHDAARFKAELLLHRVHFKHNICLQSHKSRLFRVFRYAGLVGVYKSQQPTAPVCHIKSPAQTIFTSTGWLFRLRDGHHRRIPARTVRRSGNGRGCPPHLARILQAPCSHSSPTSPPNSPTSASPSSGQLNLQNTSPAVDPCYVTESHHTPPKNQERFHKWRSGVMRCRFGMLRRKRDNIPWQSYLVGRGLKTGAVVLSQIPTISQNLGSRESRLKDYPLITP